jgi:hypothetical protein
MPLEVEVELTTKVKLEHLAQANSGGDNNKNIKRAIMEQKEKQAKKATERFVI